MVELNENVESGTWHCDWCGADIPNAARGHICPRNQAPGVSPLYYCKCPDGQPQHEDSCPAAHGGGITPAQWLEIHDGLSPNQWMDLYGRRSDRV